MTDEYKVKDGGRRAVICGIGLASGMGVGVDDHLNSLKSGMNVFHPLAELWGEGFSWSSLKGSWIPDRSFLQSRHRGPAASLVLNLARQAVLDAGWGDEELRDAALVVGSSRGNAAGWLDSFPGRRRVKLLSVPQSLHSELASCVSIELGMHGPYHVVSSGCAAGLDAIGLAWMLLKSGVVRRVLAIGADLPLVPSLLDTYSDSRMLSKHALNDPYNSLADGMLIAEGGAALALESRGEGEGEGMPVLLDYRSNSDAYSPLSMPTSGEYMANLLLDALKLADAHGLPLSLCPHASGTRGNAVSEQAALIRAFEGRAMPDFRLMKPWVGHAIGGSGILELSMMLIFARRGFLPPNVKGLVTPVPGVILSDLSDMAGNRVIFKSASSMGGHNAVVSVGVGGVF